MKAGTQVTAGTNGTARGTATPGTATLPQNGGVPRVRVSTGTYVGDAYAGDTALTSGGTPALAHDGEPAGLARVTLAMRAPVDKPSPAPRRLVGLCAWAAAVGILGALIAVWAGIEFMLGAPAWFLPVAGAIGVTGVGLTVGAFFAARKPTVPWALLGGASCMLIAAVYVIVVAAQSVAIA
jgi:hypothetical protein